MPNFYPAVGLATPEEQEKRAGALSRTYRTFMRKAAGDIEPAFDIIGAGLGPLGAGMRIFPFLSAGLRGAKGVAGFGTKTARLGPIGGIEGVRQWLSKTWGTARKGLPKFRSTEDAMVFGADYAGDQRMADLLREAAGEVKEVLRKTPKGTQEYANKAFESQFYREALETVEGKIEPKWLEQIGYEGYVPTPTPQKALQAETKSLFEGAKEDVREIMIKAFKGE